MSKPAGKQNKPAASGSKSATPKESGVGAAIADKVATKQSGERPVSIVILKTKANSLTTVETFLKNRNWKVYSTHQLQQALGAIIKMKPQYVMLAADHPNKKVMILPKLLRQAFNSQIIGFVESTGGPAMGALKAMGTEYHIYPPVSGPAITRLVLKIVKTEEEKKQQRKEKAEHQRLNPGTDAGDADGGDGENSIFIKAREALNQLVTNTDGGDGGGGMIGGMIGGMVGGGGAGANSDGDGIGGIIHTGGGNSDGHGGYIPNGEDGRDQANGGGIGGGNSGIGGGSLGKAASGAAYVPKSQKSGSTGKGPGYVPKNKKSGDENEGFQGVVGDDFDAEPLDADQTAGENGAAFNGEIESGSMEDSDLDEADDSAESDSSEDSADYEDSDREDESGGGTSSGHGKNAKGNKGAKARKGKNTGKAGTKKPSSVVQEGMNGDSIPNSWNSDDAPLAGSDSGMTSGSGGSEFNLDNLDSENKSHEKENEAGGESLSSLMEQMAALDAKENAANSNGGSADGKTGSSSDRGAEGGLSDQGADNDGDTNSSGNEDSEADNQTDRDEVDSSDPQNSELKKRQKKLGKGKKQYKGKVYSDQDPNTSADDATIDQISGSLSDGVSKQESSSDPENISLMDQAAKSSLDESVKHTPDSAVIEKIGTASNLACIAIESVKFSGYLVAAFGRDRKIDEAFIEIIKVRLFKFLKIHGQIDNESEKSMQIKIQQVEFQDWAIEKAEFLRKAVHENNEVALAFFPTAVAQTTIEKSEDEKMVKISIEDLKPNRPVEFDVYVYMPENKKYLLYTPKGKPIFDNQMDRLKTRGITHMHLREEEKGEIKKYKAQNYLDDKVTEYTEEKTKKKIS